MAPTNLFFLLLSVSTKFCNSNLIHSSPSSVTTAAFVSAWKKEEVVLANDSPLRVGLTRNYGKRSLNAVRHRSSSSFSSQRKNSENEKLLSASPISKFIRTSSILGLVAISVLFPTSPVSTVYNNGILQTSPLIDASSSNKNIENILSSFHAQHWGDSILFPPPANAADETLSPTDQNPLEEVWTLAHKYYLDQTFNNKDWDEIHQQYQAEYQKFSSTDDRKMMKLTADMISTLDDKYTRLLDRESYEQIQKFDLIGVGATLMPEDASTENNNNNNEKTSSSSSGGNSGSDVPSEFTKPTSERRLIVGAPPVSGSPADKAGIKLGDYVLEVNGIPTEGRTSFDIIDQISNSEQEEEEEDEGSSSSAATTITMTVRTVPPGKSFDDPSANTRTVQLERTLQKVQNPISYRITERRSDGTTVGYIRIIEFNSKIKSKLSSALKSLRKDGANAYVLDLRGNPGGAFQSAVEISNMFLKDGVKVTDVVDSNEVVMPFRTSSAGGDLLLGENDKVVLWIDSKSASASEVFAGSLHDNCRAVVIGEKSFGKGLIQAVYGLKNGYGLVMTVAKYLTPNGTNIQGEGIRPDVDGKGIVSDGFGVPGMMVYGSDTSKVDFDDVGRRLGMCKAP